ncbi:MAG: hypothetical protein AAGF07_04840 [Patescibacteria group bacterium]
MNLEHSKAINVVQLVSEASVIILYIISIIPAMYYVLFWILIPLVVLNFVLSIVKKDSTIAFTSVNLVMSILAFIPVIGWLAIFGGIFMSAMSSLAILTDLKIIRTNHNSSSEQAFARAEKKSSETVNPENISDVKVIKKNKNKSN